jgi:hypothetical protein
MNHLTIDIELDSIITMTESKISAFHRVRKEVDSYRRVAKSLISKKGYQQCVDELGMVSQELNAVRNIFIAFYDRNIEYFTGNMRDYLDAYKTYLECAVLASEERLNIQNVILQIKVHKNPEYKAKNLVHMMKEMDILQKDCLNRARRVNEIVNKIKENRKPRG